MKPKSPCFVEILDDRYGYPAGTIIEAIYQDFISPAAGHAGFWDLSGDLIEFIKPNGRRQLAFSSDGGFRLLKKE